MPVHSAAIEVGSLPPRPWPHRSPAGARDFSLPGPAPTADGASQEPPPPARVEPPSTRVQENRAFAEGVLDAHNRCRKIHGVQPIALDDEISRVAQEWAEKCARQDLMERKPNNEYGENIFYSFTQEPDLYLLSPEGMVKSWYKEYKNYKYQKEPTRDTIPKVGHFTQIVWRNTQVIGVGRATSARGAWYIVVNYFPKGNYLGEFKENILKPVASSSMTSITGLDTPRVKKGARAASHRQDSGELLKRAGKQSRSAKSSRRRSHPPGHRSRHSHRHGRRRSRSSRRAGVDVACDTLSFESSFSELRRQSRRDSMPPPEERSKRPKTSSRRAQTQPRRKHR